MQQLRQELVFLKAEFHTTTESVEAAANSSIIEQQEQKTAVSHSENFTLPTPIPILDDPE